MRTLFIFLFVSVVTLIIYNPTMDDFKEHIEMETMKREREKALNNVVGRLLAGEQISMNTSVMGRSTERNNYLVYSTYRVALASEDGTAHEWTYLGIGSFFFEMDAPNEIDLHAADEG